ncbi:MAG: VOC family protein [Flavobacteriaceae bacterium]|nr:VOC family protein [Flavobacteriaceae bacterium]
MLTDIHPKLPMRDKKITKKFYIEKLGFRQLGDKDYEGYLMIKKDHIEIHFFEFKKLKPRKNYGMVYIRTEAIDTLYQDFLNKGIAIHPNAPLTTQPWGQK